MVKGSLTRFDQSDHGTFGKLELADLHLFTGELPWRDNASGVSCVPAGLYRALLTFSPRFGKCIYLIDGVPKRAGIRIHSANFMGDASKGFHSQLNGCVALGERLGIMEGQKALLLSKPAIRKFENCMGKQPFLLEIKNA